MAVITSDKYSNITIPFALQQQKQKQSNTRINFRNVGFHEKTWLYPKQVKNQN